MLRYLRLRIPQPLLIISVALPLPWYLHSALIQGE